MLSSQEEIPYFEVPLNGRFSCQRCESRCCLRENVLAVVKSKEIGGKPTTKPSMRTKLATKNVLMVVKIQEGCFVNFKTLVSKVVLRSSIK